MSKKVRLILGDQLNSKHSWFNKTDEDVVYFMCEARSETDYVQHHVQKVAAFFQAMRSFAEHLQDEGHELCYLQLDDENNKGSIINNIKWCLEQYEAEQFEYQLPDEYRLDVALRELCEDLSISTNTVDSEHFLVER